VKKKNVLIYLGVVVSMLVWSLSFIWYKQLYLFNIHPISLIFFRLVISSSILWLFLLAIRHAKLPDSRIMRQIALAALFEPFFYFLGECYGIQYVTSTTAAVIISTIPLFTPLASVFILKEKLGFYNWLGIILSVLGIVMVMMENGLHFSASPLGVVLMFLAVFAAVGYSVCIKKVTGKCSSIMVVALQNTFGIIYFLPLFLIMELKHVASLNFSIEMFLPLLYLSFFASSLAFVLYIRAIDRIGAIRSNVLVNLIPVFTAIFSFFLLGEKLGLIRLLGVGVVILGVFIAQVKSKVDESPEETATHY